jgi:hypothetical protein
MNCLNCGSELLGGFRANAANLLLQHFCQDCATQEGPSLLDTIARESKTLGVSLNIIAATIGPMPRPVPVGIFDPMPTVTVTFEDGQVKELFSFYPDELSFTESEFIGLTEEEAQALRFQKDIAYLRS